jgi:hypothetical protein
MRAVLKLEAGTPSRANTAGALARALSSSFLRLLVERAREVPSNFAGWALDDSSEPVERPPDRPLSSEGRSTQRHGASSRFGWRVSWLRRSKTGA